MSMSNEIREPEHRRVHQVVQVLRRWIRRRSDSKGNVNYLIQKSDFGIRLVDPNKRANRVEMLVTRMYRQRGYDAFRKGGAPNPDESSLRRVTLEACRNGRTVGTITVNLDNPEGLRAEELYSEEIAPFRQPGTRLCEFGRLAVDVEECGKEALGTLFHLAVIFSYRIHKATDLFIEVNPRHAVFYRRKLGFKVVGAEKVCRRVNAPAMLLHQELAAISEQITRYGGLKLRENKSFYSFFMPPWEEKELIAEIHAMLEKTQISRVEKKVANIA